MKHFLTYNLYVDNSSVYVVFNLHSHLIVPRVASLGFTDKYDTVTVCVTDAYMRRFYGLALL